MQKNPIRFGEILELLASTYGNNYSLTNHTQNVYRVKRDGFAPYSVHPGEDVPFGSSLILETIGGLGRSSRLRIKKYYDGELGEVPIPEPPFFINLAQLLIMLDDKGTPLTRLDSSEPIVFRGIEVEGAPYKIAGWMELWILYMQDYGNHRRDWSEFIQAHYRHREGISYAQPKTALAERLFAAMQRMECVTAAEFAATLYGDDDHPLVPNATETIQRIIDGLPLTLNDDHTGIISLIGATLDESKGDLHGNARTIVLMSKTPIEDQSSPLDQIKS